MVCIDVFSQSAKITYKSHLCSKATIFIIITTLTSIVAPLIFAYQSRGFWLKTDSFYEQPNIKFKHKYIFYASSSNNIDAHVLCSNVIHLNDGNFQKCSVVKVHEFDYNEDGKYDELFFSLSVDGAENLNFNYVTLILILDVRIDNVCYAHLESTAIIQNIHNTAAIELNIIGNVIITQQILLPCQLYHEMFIPNKYVFDKYFDMWEFIKENAKRNVSTKVENLQNMWISGSSSTFKINANLRYPQQIIHYRPNFWQVIKFAWIQYLSLLITIHWLINKIKNYVFTNKLVLYHIESSAADFYTKEK